MLRALRLVLAFFLVPVVIFTTPSVASAAAGPWKNATVTAYNPITEALDITCQLTLRQSGIAEIPGIEIGSNGYCIGGPDITPGDAQAGESGAAYMLSVDGLTAAGVPCNGSRAGVLTPHPANGTVRVAGSVQAGFINIAESCSVQRVGIRFDGTNQDQFTWQGVDLPAVVDEPVTGGSVCPHGTPSAHVFSVFETGPGKDGGNGAGWGTVSWFVELNLSAVPPITTSGWGWYVPQFDYANGGSGSRRGQYVPGTSRYLLLEVVKHEGNADFFRTRHPNAGVQVYAWPTEGNWTAAYPNAQAELPPSGTDTIPPGADDRYLGWTDPEHCRFWFGPKIAQAEGTTLDDPAGDGVGPVVPVEEPDEPEPVVDEPEPLTDEPTDLGWLALIWGVLRSILGVISTLAQSIIDGIKEGIKALFVPDQDNWGVEDLVSQLETKPPFSLFAELEDEARAMGLAYRAGGSCGTIADFGNGGVLNCATIANVPGFSALYALVSAGLMGLTGWGMFLMVSRLFEQGQ